MSASQSWFEITNKAGSPAAQILIYGEIGAYGITPADFRAALDQVPSDRDIEIHCHSPGGSVMDGFVMYDTIARRRDRVTGVIDGTAASMMTVILCACKKVVMAENGWFMIHEIEGGAGGRVADMQRAAKVMETCNDQVVAVYAEKTGKAPAEIRKKMAATTWFTAKEAKAFGFVDEISSPIDMTGKTDFSDRFKNGPKAVSDPNPEDPNPSTPRKPNMKKLLAALVEKNLISSADLAEDAIVSEFTANFADTETELTTLRNTAKTLAQTEAETAIDAAIADKRIVVAETDTEKKLRALWIKNYVANPTDTKAMLDGMKAVAAAAEKQEEKKNGRDPLNVKGAADTVVAGDTAALWAAYNAMPNKTKEDAKAKTLFFRNNIKPVLAKAGLL